MASQRERAEARPSAQEGARGDAVAALYRLLDHQQFEALRDQTRAQLERTGDVQLWPLLALAHAQLGALGEAAEQLERAEACRSRLALDARVDLAGVYCAFRRLDEALALLQPALAEQPEHALALARLAWVRRLQGATAEARALYEDAVGRAPQRLPLWLALAQLQLEAGEPAAAQGTLDAAQAQLEAQRAELPERALQGFTHQLGVLQLELWLDEEALGRAEAWVAAQRPLLSENDYGALVCAYAALLAGRNRHDEAEEALRGALEAYPDNLALLGDLAALLQFLGRTHQALGLLRRGVALGQDRDRAAEIRFLARLSEACQGQRPRDARWAAEQAMERAEALREGDALSEGVVRGCRGQAKTALAQVEGHEGNFARAEQLFQAVLEENPHHLAALQGLGQQYLQLGRVEAAIALFERMRALDPVKGHSALISARRFPEDSAELDRLEAAAMRPSLEGPVRAGLLFHLAAAWEKKGAHGRAFTLAARANQASRGRLAYDAKAHRQHCARLRYAFCKALYAHRPDCGYRGEDAQLPVYVVGMPRSGTTLVEQILAGHSQIFGAGELGVIPQRIAGLNRWERRVGSGRAYPDCVDDLSPEVVQGIASGIITELRELAAADKPAATQVIDKLPHNFENLGLIKFLFPEAKIISVRRDPRDIAISNYFIDYAAKHGGMGFAYDLTDIGEQLADHNLLMQHWEQCFPGQIHEVHYDALLADPEGEARRMLAYLGQPWEPEVLAFSELERPVKTASVWQVRQPLYQSSRGRWESYRARLGPLLRGTNGKITWDPIEDMVSLPEPGLLERASTLYREGRRDDAEYQAKKLLHHLPDHGGANYLLGIIYWDKGYREDGLALLEKALLRCPWNRDWREDFLRACDALGENARARRWRRDEASAEPDPVAAAAPEAGALEACFTESGSTAAAPLLPSRAQG